MKKAYADLRLLIVDDQIDKLRLLNQAATSLGITEIQWAKSVREALDVVNMLEAGHFNLVITDYLLAVRGPNGGEMVMACHEDFRDYPEPPVVIMASGDPDEAREDGLVAEALKEGLLKSLLRKPWEENPKDIQRFETELKHAIEQHC